MKHRGNQITVVDLGLDIDKREQFVGHTYAIAEEWSLVAISSE